MIDVTTDWWVALIYAGVAGLIGGLVYELVSPHGAADLKEGQIEVPGSASKPRAMVDIGFIASMLIGGVTAIAFLYFLEPQTITDGGNEIRQYDGIKLVAAALLVGTGGSSVLKSLRERLLRQQVEALVEGTERLASDPAARESEATAKHRLDAVATLVKR